MLVFERLSRVHDRSGFDCGEESLNTYIKQRASQDIRRRLSTCIVLADNGNGQILGFYALSVGGLAADSMPAVPRAAKAARAYGTLPVAVLGRLAVAKEYQGRGLSKKLVRHAIYTTLRSPIPVAGLIVDPLDASKASFYEKLGFKALAKGSNKMILMFESEN